MVNKTANSVKKVGKYKRFINNIKNAGRALVGKDPKKIGQPNKNGDIDFLLRTQTLGYDAAKNPPKTLAERTAFASIKFSQLNKIHDLKLLEEEIGASVLDKVFSKQSGYHVEYVKFLAFSQKDFDRILKRPQLNKSVAERLKNGATFNNLDELIDKVSESKRMDKLGSMMGIPFISEDKENNRNLFGIAVVSGKFTAEDDQVAHLVSCNGSSVVANALNIKDLEEKALFCATTGAYSKWYLDDLLIDQDALAGRESNNKPYSVIMFDVDHFKTLNDENGHPAGDKVLRKVVDLIKKIIRKTDAICSYGGDEYVVVLPGTSAKEAAEIALKIQNEIDALQVPVKNGKNLKVTISGGIATYRMHAFDHFNLIDQADQGLYASKGDRISSPKGNRNRMTMNINGAWMLAAKAIEELKKMEAKQEEVNADKSDGKVTQVKG